jgi:hypothetical protein
VVRVGFWEDGESREHRLVVGELVCEVLELLDDGDLFGDLNFNLCEELRI